MLSTHRITKLLLRRLPILVWLPKYNKQDAISDLIAGITVGLTLMPQAIAYAALAGLEPQYGLYSGCVGILMYIIFGSTRQITIGPTALLSLLTYNYTNGFGGATHNHDVVVLFTFLVGVIELLCGIFQLGFLVNFVSTPVISGFTSAAALIIASAQMKNLFGLSYNAESFVNIWSKFFKHKSETKVYDLILGISCMLVLVILKKLNSINFGAKNSSKVKRLKKVFWVISTGRNALVVVMCASLSYYLQNHLRITPFTLTGNIASGMPSLKLPKFSTVANGTEVGFVEMASYMGSGLVVAPLIGVLSNLALAKAFSNGGQVDATQEMIALGMCNIVGSFARSMPVAGAFSRSAVNTASGVRTTFGCVYTSVLVLLTLSFLTPYFYYIPRASLAAVIVTAVLIMIDINIIIKPIWSIHKLDLLPGFITFIFCLFIGIEVGLIIGVSIDMILILYNSAKPTVAIENVDFSPSVGGSYWFVTINYDTIPFPAIDHIRSSVFSRTSLKNHQKKQESSGKTVVINSLHMKKIDFTSAQGLNTLLSDLSAHNIELVLLIRNQQNLVLSISRLCPDLKIVSSIDELESMILKSKDLNNKSRVFDVIENNCSKINDESNIKNDKVSINMVSEETRF